MGNEHARGGAPGAPVLPGVALAGALTAISAVPIAGLAGASPTVCSAFAALAAVAVVVAGIAVQNARRVPGGAADPARKRDDEPPADAISTHLALVAASASDLVFLVDPGGRVRYASPSFLRAWGQGLENVVGRAFTERILPGDHDRVRAMVATALEAGTARGTVRAELPGGEVRVYDAVMSRSSSGGAPAVAVAARDTTEQERLAAQLQQAQKLEAVAQLAGGVAHDFTNLLAVVQSGVALVRQALPPEDASQAVLADVGAAAERGAALTRRLLSMGRRAHGGPERCAAAPVLAELARFVPRLLGHGANLRVTEEPGTGEVPVSADKLEQVLLNLVINARDAMPRGGWIRVAARARDLRAGEAGPLAPGAYLEIAVQDDGIGMDADVRQRLFEPFFSTKEAGRGTGLGLVTSLGIATRAGGSILVESEPGRGSTFRVLLPRLEPAAGGVPPEGAARRRPRVLIADHDPALVALLSRMLAARGHDVVTASSSGEARQQAASFPGAVDVVVAGLELGASNGVQVLGEVRRTSPLARGVLLSGDVREDADMAHLLDAGVELVRKPVAPEALARVVERAAIARGRAGGDTARA